jgi:hypothetical protein
VLGFPTEWSELFLTSILRFRTQLICSKSDRGSVFTLVLRRVKRRLTLRTPCNTCTIQVTFITCRNGSAPSCKLTSVFYSFGYMDMNSFLTGHIGATPVGRNSSARQNRSE